MFDNSVLNTQSNVKKAIKYIESFAADMNLTEIQTPIKVVFEKIKQKKNNSTNQHVYLMTDGAVDDAK